MTCSVQTHDTFLHRIRVKAISDTTETIISALADERFLDDLAASANQLLRCMSVHTSSVSLLSGSNVADDRKELIIELIEHVQSHRL